MEAQSPVGEPVIAYFAHSNPQLRLTIEDYGTMVFEIYESHVPELANHLVALVQSGHYDGLEIYRVNDDVIQAGDPTKLALSAQDEDSVDDEFHPHLRHDGPGVLSMAKLVDDGIGSNFFITTNAKPEFDYHFSIVGRLVDGQDVQDAIEAARTGVGGFPQKPIVISAATIDHRAERATLVVAADENSVPSDITVTRDGESETIQITIDGQSPNAGPYIEFAGQLSIPGVGFVMARDNEGDATQFHLEVADDSGASVSIENENWIVVTPPEGYTGTVEVDVWVSSVGAAVQLDRFDRQRATIDTNLDVTGDGEVTVADLDAVCRAGSAFSDAGFQVQTDVYSVIVGDVNSDNVFDSGDLVDLFAENQYEDGVEANSTWSTGDFNCDGEFDSSDLILVFETGTYENR